MNLTLHPYRLPLRQALITAQGPISERHGWLVAISDGQRQGWGEACPLPSFGGEDHATCAAALHAARDHLNAGHEPNLATLPPCARSAVEGALLDLQAQHSGLPLARYLSANAATSIEVNALATSSNAADLAANGWTTLKLKVAGDPIAAADHLNALRRNLPATVNLRADANAGWTLTQSHAFLDHLTPGCLSLLEQPVADVHDLAELRHRGDCLIAADEAVRDQTSLAAVLAAKAADVIVLKPMLLGGWAPSQALAADARAAGCAIVITSTLDAAIGRSHAAHIAAALNAPGPHGLATGALLHHDLAQAPSPQAGRLALNNSPGLGCHGNVP
ncbi:MAG: o-succinylbenzoate synthase [Planctomycetota bacterium]|jgi:o-succinylbenzoate synthase